jgi:peptide deformylase
VPTPRASRAVATGVDLDGQPVMVEGTGVLARCLQHEVDHLGGLLFLDRLPDGERRQALRTLRGELGPPGPDGAGRPGGRGGAGRGGSTGVL